MSYTYTYAVDTQPLIFENGTGPSAATGGQFPAVTTQWQRVDATARYKVDEPVVRYFGWNGDVYASIRYAWERNSVNNWQTDSIVPYAFAGYCGGIGAGTPGCGYQTWMAQDNPNYNVHMLSGSITAKW